MNSVSMMIMMKNICLSLFIFCLFSCSKPEEIDIRNLENSIISIENSINTLNLNQYRHYSKAMGFYQFFSSISVFNGKSGSLIKIHPEKFTSSFSGIDAFVSITYEFDVNQIAGSAGIPRGLLKILMKDGLPQNADFYFRKKESVYYLERIQYPPKYFYMNLFAQ